MRLLLFIGIEIVLMPFWMLGVLGYTVRLYLFNIPKGISGTAYEPFWQRLMFHDAGVRREEAAGPDRPLSPSDGTRGAFAP